MRHNQHLYFLAFFLYALLGLQIAAAQKLQNDYTVFLSNPENHLFHVTTDIKNIRQANLDVSLPTWTPGNKETESLLIVGSRDETHYVLTELPQATAPQLKIREGWLKDKIIINT